MNSIHQHGVFLGSVCLLIQILILLCGGTAGLRFGSRRRHPTEFGSFKNAKSRTPGTHSTPNAQRPTSKGRIPKGRPSIFHDPSVARLVLFPWKLGVGRWALGVGRWALGVEARRNS